MAIQTRNSVFAVTVETTEGTPVAPSAGAEFLPIRDGAEITQEFEKIDNEELKASLGSAKSITGFESPSSSIPLYLKHSGVEGQAPGYGELLKAAFGGERLQSTEYNTVAASTTSVIKVDAGEGVNFARGDAILIKDGTNGYSIGVILSVAGDDLTLLFNVGTAPAVGVDLGKFSSYYMLDSNHQTLSLWHYLGNSGAVKMIAGCRVTETTITANAGELMTAEFSLEGLTNYFNPVEITASDIYLDFTDDGGSFAAVISPKMYSNPHEVSAALQTSMNTVQTAETHAVSYSDSTGLYTVETSTSTVLSLLWNTGGNTANSVGDKIGFSLAADDTGSTAYSSGTAIDLTAQYTVAFDDVDPITAKNHLAMVGDATDTACFAASAVTFTMSTPKTDINSICAESGRSGSIINAREVTVELSALLNQYDADFFRRIKDNDDVRFQYNFGTKTGGNWDAGKSGAMSLLTATVDSIATTDADGLVQLDLTLKAYVDSTGSDEAALSFV